MLIEEKELKEKIEYQQCQKDLIHLENGIKITEAVWCKYVEQIQKLIASNKIKDQVVIEIQNKIQVLNEHWNNLSVAWDFKLKPEAIRGYHDPFDPNPNQQVIINALIPKDLCKKELYYIAEKIADLHHTIQQFAYPFWWDRLYQFIQTSLLKLYNCLFAGPVNLSTESVYLVAADYGSAKYTPSKYNYFICQEKLSHNTDLLKKDLQPIENFQNAFLIDNISPKR